MNNITDYCLVNRKEIEDKIQEIEESYFKVKGKNDADGHYLDGARTYLKEILNNSISAESVIRNSFKEGWEQGEHMEDTYIKNLNIKK